MFTKKSQADSETNYKRRGTELMNQMGLDMPASMEDLTAMQPEGGDDDLEAELATLLGNERPSKKTSTTKKELVPVSTMEHMAAESLKNVDEDVSDTEDPELLAELEELKNDGEPHVVIQAAHTSQTLDPAAEPSPSETTPRASLASSNHSQLQDGQDRDTESIIQGRLQMYQQALEQAKESGDESKQRRLDRGLKTLTDLLLRTRDGKAIRENEIPPPVALGTSAVSTVYHMNAPPSSASEEAASEDAHQTATYLRENGTPHSEDMSELPPEPTEQESQKLFQAPEAPKTVMEALTQRLEKYKSSENSAREAGDSNRSRRMGRIVKRYESAIKMYTAGKPVDFSELPTPPGFGPIPKEPDSSQQSLSSPGEGCPAAAAGPVLLSQQGPSVAQRTNGAAASDASVAANVSLDRNRSKEEYQLYFLQERVEESRAAALKAKKNQNLGLAKEHLRSMKHLESLIETLKAGQPVDLSQIPPAPCDDDSDKYVTVNNENCPPAADREAMFSQLEQDLIHQIRICATNSQHFTKVGDASAAASFQKLEQSSRKDLESLKNARSRGDPVPKFHYETRSFSAVQCNTDLGDGEMEITIIRGICLSLPSGFSEKDMNTMVKYEFSFPSQEDPQTGQTPTVKETVNPEYDAAFKLRMDRKSRSFMRFVERKGIKLDIYIKRGFLKGEKLLGSSTVKLSSLDTKCTMHDSFDLTEGRKSVGGKLEVKVRVRDPFKGRQVEESKEKWLVIDQFIHNLAVKSQLSGAQKTKDNKSSVCTVL